MTGDALTFECPRCARDATQHFWGPCQRCRDELAVSMRREAEDVGPIEYEPKMNVVPNQVASKE